MSVPISERKPEQNNFLQKRKTIFKTFKLRFYFELVPLSDREFALAFDIDTRITFVFDSNGN